MRPNWTNNQLNEAYLKWRYLVDETAEHDIWHLCHLCSERARLRFILNRFTEDEKAGAVIAINNGRGDELVDKVLESEFQRS